MPNRKKCSDCGIRLPLTDFTRSKQSKSGYLSKCKTCNAKYYRERYLDEDVRARISANQRKFTQTRYEVIVDAKSAPCTDCGNTYPPYVMDFDHVHGDKLFNIGSTGRRVSIDALKLEIAKCEVVCANCHRVRTHIRKTIGN